MSTKDAAACKEFQTRGEHPDGLGSSWDSGFLSPSLSFPLFSFLSQLFPTLSLPPVSLPSSSDDSQTGIYADPQPYLEDVWSSASHSPWALAALCPAATPELSRCILWLTSTLVSYRMAERQESRKSLMRTASFGVVAYAPTSPHQHFADVAVGAEVSPPPLSTILSVTNTA